MQPQNDVISSRNHMPEVELSEMTARQKVGCNVGKTVNRALERLNNALELEFFECADVMFECSGRNSLSFNRLFGVLESDGASILRNVENNTVMVMKPGCLYLISSRLNLEFVFKPATHFLAFHFSLKLFHNQDLLHNQPIFQEIADRMDVIRHLYQLIYEPVITVGSLCDLRSLIMRELVPWLGHLSLERQCRNYYKYAKVLDYIHARRSAQISVAELSDIAGMSREVLSRSFSADYGISIKSYMTHFLVAQAEKLLRDPALKISQVAQQLEFTDEYYFSRFFKKQTGATPSEFRRFNTVLRH